MIGLAGAANAAVIITESSTAPVGAAISQPDFSAPGFNGGQDFSDNAGPSGQTFTPATNLSLKNVAVKGFANNVASFGNLPASFTVTISQVNGTTLTQLSQEVSNSFNPVDGSDYYTFALASPVVLTAGTQYAFDISTTAGYFGFAKSSTDVYAGGSAFQAGSVSRTSTTRETITNVQCVDRTFFINTPEPASLSFIGLGMVTPLARRRRA